MPERPLRVLQVVPQMTLSLGGPLISALSLAAGLTARGAEVRFLTMRAELDQPMRKRFGLEDGQILMTREKQNRFRMAAQDQALIGEAVAGCDVVHAHGIWESIIFEAVRAASEQYRPAVISACGMLDEWSLARKRLKKSLYRMLRGRTLFAETTVHATGAFEQAELIRAGILLENIAQIPLPLPPQEPAGAVGGGKQASGDAYLIGCLGRIAPGKGLELLLESFAVCARQSKDPLLLEITGPSEPGYLSALRDRAAVLKISDKVRFDGPLSGYDVHARLASYDLFALLSEHENFGLSIAEALAAGTPVVISPFTGLSQLVESEQTGTVCARDVDSASRAMLAWYRRKRDDADLSRRCSSLAGTRFAPEKIADEWMRLYRSLIVRASGGGA